MTDRLARLAERFGLEEQACATAAAAHRRGAKFVDVAYFDSSRTGTGTATLQHERAAHRLHDRLG